MFEFATHMRVLRPPSPKKTVAKPEEDKTEDKTADGTPAADTTEPVGPAAETNETKNDEPVAAAEEPPKEEDSVSAAAAGEPK